MANSTSDPCETAKSSRRSLLLAGSSGIAALAGCLDGFSEESGPQERSFEVTITTSDGQLVGTVAEADVEDVVQVHVEDTVVFTFVNETGDLVGVHDHASDSDVRVASGGEQTIEFEVTEAMIGRQEIEAWFADETDQEDAEGHEQDATAIIIVEVRPRGS